MAMPRITGGTVVKLLVLSLVVGLILAGLNIDPQNILVSMRDGAIKLFDMGVELFGWAFTYVLIGAVVVIPIWLIMYLWRYMRGSR
tara:strand:- start:230 stop:487 length:258 start_codon:yes stop_codon:yes gene_type:complete